MKPFLLALLISAAFISCSHHKTEHVERAFYYWKSDDGSFRDKELEAIKAQKITKVYVKFFEVAYNETMGPVPVSKSSLNYLSYYDSQRKEAYNVIPTVFIKNEVFLNSTKQEIDTLVSNMDFLIRKYYKERFYYQTPAKEYQIDCDWTIKSKDNYFYFLKQFKAFTKKQISCTLRLYPYKYRTKMGIPPVDKATLMCYNLIQPLEDKSRNSILDIDELRAYLDVDKKYPLHLDIALPVFSWMHVYHYDRFKDIVYPEPGIKSILKPIKPLWYEVKKDTMLDDVFLRAGDKVKYEEITTAKVREAIAVIKKGVVFDKTTTVTLFHLDEKQLKNYSHEAITRFYTDFTK